MTKINCDGQADAPCPTDSSRLFAHPQAISLRLARKEGWEITEFTICPACTGAVSSDSAPATGSIGMIRRPVSASPVLLPPPADSPLSIGPGRSSVSRAAHQSGTPLALGWRQLSSRHRGMAR